MKIESLNAYVKRFVTDAEFRESRPWMEKLIGKLTFLTPNQWTNSRYFFGPASAFVARFLSPLLALVVSILSDVTDAIDGAVKRHNDKKMGLKPGEVDTKSGDILDGLADKVSFNGRLSLLKIFFPAIVSALIVWPIVLIDFFAYGILYVVKKDKIKANENPFKHLAIGKYKFTSQALFSSELYISLFINPTWPWWIFINNAIGGIVLILTLFSLLCKIDERCIKFLANAFTTANAICGCMSIYHSFWQCNFPLAGALIILAAVFDAVDGTIARKFGSWHGDIFDDVADFVSFGLAPAVLGFALGVPSLICLTYLIFTFVRLVHFTKIKKEGGVFDGLASTAAAILLGSLMLWKNPFSASGFEMFMIGCFTLEVAFIAEWYHFRNFGNLPIWLKSTYFIVFLGSMLLGRMGEGMTIVLLSYIVIFFKPVFKRVALS